MSLKWDKKICIQHIIELKDPLEEQKGNGQANLSPLTQAFRGLGREVINKFRTPER